MQFIPSLISLLLATCALGQTILIQPYLQDCYDDVLIHDSSIKGRPKLILQIVKNQGTVEDLEITNLKAKSKSLKSLRRCFLDAYRHAQIPQANQNFYVTYTLVMNH